MRNTRYLVLFTGNGAHSYNLRVNDKRQGMVNNYLYFSNFCPTSDCHRYTAGIVRHIIQIAQTATKESMIICKYVKEN